MAKTLLLFTALWVSSPTFAADALNLSPAIALYKQKDYEKAGAAFAELESANPENPQVAYYLGRIAQRQKRYEAAVTALEKATRLDPQNPEYFIALGDVYGAIANQTRSFATARQSCSALEHAVELAPRSEEARAALISFCRKAPSIVGGGMNRAYEQAKQLRALDAPAGTRLLATLYEGEQRFDEAFVTCAETLGDYPDDYGLLYVTGRIAAASGKHIDQGIAALEKSLTLPPVESFPGHAAAHVRLGQLYAKKSATAEARQHFEAALKLEPGNKDAEAALTALPAP